MVEREISKKFYLNPRKFLENVIIDPNMGKILEKTIEGLSRIDENNTNLNPILYQVIGSERY